MAVTAGYLTTQIPEIVKDAFNDLVGTNASLSEIDTSDFVSMGKALDSFNLLDGWYGALTHRIIRTVMFARSYSAKTRNILRDETSWGAFVQKIYLIAPDEVDNPAFDIPQVTPPSTKTYSQHSPYDVETALECKSLIYGNNGTWSYEFIQPTIQIQAAWNGPAEMNAFVDAQFVAVQNRVEGAKEAVVNAAVNTSIAKAIADGRARNLLAEYNTHHAGATIATVEAALENVSFLKYMSKEINKTVENMQMLNTGFNGEGYATFTPAEKMHVDVLSEAALNMQYYLEADTFNKNLIQLPGYTSIPAWQGSGSNGRFKFDTASKINVKHADINSGEAVEQGGIVAFIYDDENVAAYFGNEYQWTMPNPRDRISIHGYQYMKGYAVDNYANSVVFYLAAE